MRAYHNMGRGSRKGQWNNRLAEKESAEALYRLVQSTIRTVYPNYYPQGVVEFFSALHIKERIAEDAENGLVRSLYVDRRLRPFVFMSAEVIELSGMKRSKCVTEQFWCMRSWKSDLKKRFREKSAWTGLGRQPGPEPRSGTVKADPEGLDLLFRSPIFRITCIIRNIYK